MAISIFKRGGGKKIAATVVTLSTSLTKYVIPKGKHSGQGKVQIVLEEKSVTSGNAATTVTPTSGKVLSQVTVNAINIASLRSASRVAMLRTNAISLSAEQEIEPQEAAFTLTPLTLSEIKLGNESDSKSISYDLTSAYKGYYFYGLSLVIEISNSNSSKASSGNVKIVADDEILYDSDFSREAGGSTVLTATAAGHFKDHAILSLSSSDNESVTITGTLFGSL